MKTRTFIGPDFFPTDKKKEPNFAMKLALGLDVQTNAKFPGAARTELESQLQRAVKVSAKGKHMKCKMDLERCLFWDPAGRGVRAPQGPRARVADGHGTRGGAVLPVLGRLQQLGACGP